MSRPFSFKRFTIVQEASAMKVGTDGVLIGAWSRILPSDRHALDIGTGTGVVALMLAQRGESSGLHVDAVEIDGPSAGEAASNVSNSPWPDRVAVVHDSLQHYASSTPRRYDLIVSNPPFFVDSLTAPDKARTTARHAVSLTHGELLSCSSALLAGGGRLCVVLPYDRQPGFIADARAVGLTSSRITHVCPKPNTPPKRSLLEFVRYGDFAGQVAVESITIELSARHDYSAEYRALTADFYLKF